MTNTRRLRAALHFNKEVAMSNDSYQRQKDNERLESINKDVQDAINHGLKYGRQKLLDGRKLPMAGFVTRKTARKHWLGVCITQGDLTADDAGNETLAAAFDFGFMLAADEWRRKDEKEEKDHAENSRPGDSWPLVKWDIVVKATIDREQTNE